LSFNGKNSFSILGLIEKELIKTKGLRRIYHGGKMGYWFGENNKETEH
jgi:hypothetical protein